MLIEKFYCKELKTDLNLNCYLLIECILIQTWLFYFEFSFTKYCVRKIEPRIIL